MIEVVHPGLFTTVQDLGREGMTHLGVSPSGAADPVSLRVGNWLVGNPPGAAALEMTLLGGTYLFLRDALAVVTGKHWRAVGVAAGGVLEVGPITSGARAYLCVSGGIDVASIFGSRSTHVPSGLGGFEGRALRRGDVVPVAEGTLRAPRGLPEHLKTLLVRSKTLRITPGAQSSQFSAGEAMRLLSSDYAVQESSNRMGLRLTGPPLACRGPEMRSEGVPLGAVQIPPSGEPILLGVDAQTTGGYPVIGAVISADLASLGQLRPRDAVRFAAIGFDEARDLALQQSALLSELS